MLLKSLKLKNIRSYEEQTIFFPPEPLLLSGDIGSGKSTLLLAIEFALFGLSKPDLTGEALLRKGTCQGKVELTFQLEGKEITIQRNLKKSRNNIQQTAGYLIKDGFKKELTPLELKAEIIALLCYPEEFITKTKNYLFRYSVYCPQEEMKLILQENPETRLNLLRKIFNLDKYQRIRENLFFYLKEIKKEILVFETKLSPLEEKKKQLKDLKAKEKIIREQLLLLLPQIKSLKEKIKFSQERLRLLEKRNQEHFKLKNELVQEEKLLEEKRNQKKYLREKQVFLEEKLKKFVFPKQRPEIEEELKKWRDQEKEFLSQKSSLETKLGFCRQQEKILQKEISQLEEQVGRLKQKEEEKEELLFVLSKKEKVRKEKEKREDLLEQIKKEINQIGVFLHQIEEIQKKISQLEQCPTCLQKLSLEYKKKVLQEQEEKKKEKEKLWEELKKEKKKLQQQLLELNQEEEILLRKETQLIKLEVEINTLREKKILLKERKLVLRKRKEEINWLIKELAKLKPEDLVSLQKKISYCQELLREFDQRRALERELKEIVSFLDRLREEEKAIFYRKEQLEKQLKDFPDQTTLLLREKEKEEELKKTERILFSEKIKLQTQEETLQQQISLLIKEIETLTQFKKQLTRMKEVSYWLEEFLIDLTHLLEKQIMLKIYFLFNQLFQEWFSLLIEDENFSARLDDSFTPLIEQNGYEISFSNLSGGERTAAALAYRLALNKVINELVQEIKTKDLLILDEPTDGFSEEQLDRMRDVLGKLNLKQIILVSHENKIESFVDKIIRITKREGRSYIEPSF